MTPPDGAPVPVAGLRGEIGGAAELLTTTLPALRAGIQAVAQDLADAVNAAHGSGHDAAGAPGRPFFAVDPTAPGGPLVLLLTDPAALAASGVAGEPAATGPTRRPWPAPSPGPSRSINAS